MAMVHTPPPPALLITNFFFMNTIPTSLDRKQNLSPHIHTEFENKAYSSPKLTI